MDNNQKSNENEENSVRKELPKCKCRAEDLSIEPKKVENCSRTISNEHVKSLAHPNRIKLLHTFDQNLKHLDIFRTEHFLKNIFDRDTKTPREAVKSFKKSNHKRKIRSSLRRRQLAQRIFRRKRCILNRILNKTFCVFRPYLLDECGKLAIPSQLRRAVDSILLDLSDLLG